MFFRHGERLEPLLFPAACLGGPLARRYFPDPEPGARAGPDAGERIGIERRQLGIGSPEKTFFQSSMGGHW